MKKRILSTMLILTMLLSFMPVMANAEENIKVELDGKTLSFDVPPQIINDRTMVPLRAIFEALGASVDWNQQTQTVTSTKGNTTIMLTINNPTMYVNGKSVTLDTPACVVNDRTLVPVRAISEAYNTTVSWDGDTRTATLLTENAPSSLLAFYKLKNAILAHGENFLTNHTDKQSASLISNKSYITLYFSSNGTSVTIEVSPNSENTHYRLLTDNLKESSGYLDKSTHHFNVEKNETGIDETTINAVIDASIDMMSDRLLNKFNTGISMADLGIEKVSDKSNNNIFHEIMTNPCEILKDKILTEGEYDKEKNEYSLSYTNIAGLDKYSLLKKSGSVSLSYQPRADCVEIFQYETGGASLLMEVHPIASTQVFLKQDGQQYKGEISKTTQEIRFTDGTSSLSAINGELQIRMALLDLDLRLSDMKLGISLKDLGI